MDFLHFANVSFEPNASIWRLCEDLNNVIEYGIWYDTFQVQNRVVMVIEQYRYDHE